MGDGSPAITTVAPCNVLLNGRPAAPPDASARSPPNTETIAPGASGTPGAKLAPLTIPESWGASLEALKPPEISSDPCKSGWTASAFTVMVSCAVALLLLGLHVACHWPPLPSDIRLSGASPFENEATTLPASTGLPQSSTT